MKEKEPVILSVQLRAYSKTEIAELYKISMKGLSTWLAPLKEELGPRVGRFYSPKQVEIIFREYGIPKMLYYTVEKFDVQTS
jgi:transposase